jgi:hypothetical protein
VLDDVIIDAYSYNVFIVLNFSQKQNLKIIILYSFIVGKQQFFFSYFEKHHKKQIYLNFCVGSSTINYRLDAALF